VDAGSTHPAGLQFDSAIVSACLAQTELEFSDIRPGYVAKYLNIDLPAAWAIDGRSGPKKIGVSSAQGRYMTREAVEYTT
jgi:hypothetical protein